MMKNFEELITQRGMEAAALLERVCSREAGTLNLAAHAIMNTIRKDGRILIAGNGGSAADSQHFAAEFVNRFLMERRPLPAIALTTDTSILTSIANDYSFEQIFSRQVEALGREGDILISMSTSGASPNILRAIEKANTQAMTTIGMTGADPGRIGTLCDICLSVPDASTPRVQEVHHLALHLLCEVVETGLFSHGY